MKKKIKDITIGEVKKECEMHDSCYECPFNKLNYCAMGAATFENLEKEIKLTRDEDERKSYV